MNMINALLITMKIVMKIVIKRGISLHEISDLEDAITDIEQQIERMEDAADD